MQKDLRLEKFFQNFHSYRQCNRIQIQNGALGVRNGRLLSIKFLCVTLWHMSIRAGVIVAVPLHEVNAAPNAKSCAKRDYQSLQYVNCAVEKIHINLAFCR